MHRDPFCIQTLQTQCATIYVRRTRSICCPQFLYPADIAAIITTLPTGLGTDQRVPTLSFEI